MSFLGSIFKKKPGGTVLGNLFRGVAGAIPIIGGTVIGTGANKIELGQTKTNLELAKEATTFAGQPAVKESDGTYSMSTPLNVVNISASKAKSETPMPAWVEKLGDIAGSLVGKATEKATVGVNDKTLIIVGGIGLLIVGAIVMNGNTRRY